MHSYKKERFDGLDSLRGIAIVLVMLGHFIPQVFPNMRFPVVSTFGGAGVLLFFYLSGFLIFNSLQSQSPWTFLIRRFFKLMPAYWASVLVIVCMAMFLQVGSGPDWTVMVCNLLMVQDIVRTELLSGVYWTLLIEVKFYVLMAVFCMLARAHSIYWLLLSLLMVNIVTFFFLQRGSVLVTYLITFFPGIVAARLLWMRGVYFYTVEYWLIGFVVAINLYVFLPIGNVSQAVFAITFLGVLLLFLKKDFKNRFLNFFGKISYSYYLFHTVLGYPLIDYMRLRGVDGMAILCAVSVATVLIATVSFYLVERPAMEWGRQFLKARALRLHLSENAA